MTEVKTRNSSMPELEAEQEVDFARYGRAIVSRWWLLVLGLVAGVIIGWLTTLGGSKVYEAESISYMGTPLAPGAGGPVLSVTTQLALAEEYALAETTIRKVAATVGMKPSQLRNHVALNWVSGVASPKSGVVTPLLSITVTGGQPKKIVAAANELSALVGARNSSYVDTKIKQIESRLAYDGDRIEIVNARLARARRQLQFALDSPSLDPASRLISIQNFSSIVNSSEARLGGLETDRFAVRQTLALAKEVEQGKLLTEAAAVPTSAKSRRNSLVVGGLIGLIIGLLAAVLWDPIAGRFASRPAQ